MSQDAVPAFRIPITVANLMRNPLEALTKLYENHGELVHLPVPFKPSYFVYSPEYAQRILGKDAQHFYKSANYNEFYPLLGQGLVTSDGELWKKQRATYESAFSMMQLKAFVPAIQRHAKQWIARTKEGSCAVGEDMMALTYVILGEALFGQNIGDSAETVRKTFPVVTDYLMKRIYVQLPKWLPVPGYKHYKKSLAELNRVVFELIAKERKNKGQGQHLLAQLVKQSDEVHAMSDELLRDEVMTLLLAGHETTANTLSWTLYCLANAPDVVEKMREELSACEDDIDFATYKTLNYTRAVVQESMRLFPPAYLISRQPIAEYELADRVLKAGSVAYIPIWCLHRREDIWPNALNFDPNRFFNSKLTPQQRNAFLPFGAGPRRCIGSELAMIEAVIILSYIVRTFDILPLKQKIKPHPSLTLRAAHLKLDLKSRCVNVG